MCTVIFLCTKVVSSLSRRKCLPALQSHPHPTPTPAPPLHPNLSVGHRHARNIIALIFLIFFSFSFRFDKNRRFLFVYALKPNAVNIIFGSKTQKTRFFCQCFLWFVFELWTYVSLNVHATAVLTVLDSRSLTLQ